MYTSARSDTLGCLEWQRSVDQIYAGGGPTGVDKWMVMWSSREEKPPPTQISIGGMIVPWESQVQYLGLTLGSFFGHSSSFALEKFAAVPWPDPALTRYGWKGWILQSSLSPWFVSNPQICRKLDYLVLSNYAGAGQRNTREAIKVGLR